MTDETPDRIEIWGRRLGRGLAYVALGVLFLLFILSFGGEP
ncbi:hypothetical protein FHS82_001134 [Pseudochelatococcus lubricantis]|uniref:Uncharacterized protein n=1 Tax=Pseudochelatococcus lubricantis TaxID=1538102 RepID=A0ABX0UWI3_9HYPH|nr:hypothetical protein [Pseudochelatococcus lubricantis]NIJ57308.1 hypothetical protein [Pseudochelatococcus lubricantis]